MEILKPVMGSGMHFTEWLINTTVRIQSVRTDKTISTGTGFYFGFFKDNSKSQVTKVLITNKHVIRDSKKMKLYFKGYDKTGLPNYNAKFEITEKNPQAMFVNHPDPEVDLCAIPASYFHYNIVSKGHMPYIRSYFTEDNLLTQQDFESISFIEEILMIGYPNGLWDEAHNLPIVRKGITATGMFMPFNNKDEFLVDVAAFPGSSGSPIIWIKDINSKETGVSYPSFLKLVGTLYAGPTHSTIGEIKSNNQGRKNNNPNIAQVKIKIPNNLGIAIQARRIMELQELVIQKGTS